MKKQQKPAWYKGKRKDCDRCGQEYPKKELKGQKGLLVCKYCFDNTSTTRRK